MKSNREKQIVRAFIEEYGFAPTGIYCQFTGKLIGYTSRDEFSALMESLDGEADSAANDLAIRIFASMRPSMRFNKMRSESLEEIRQTAPRDVMAYLANRLFSSLESHKLSVERRLGDLEDRVTLYEHMRGWDVEAEPFKLILHMLLEIDAKINLNKESAPFTVRDFLDCDGTPESFAKLVEMVEAWWDRRIKAWSEQQRVAAEEANWFKGNTLAREAFFGSWMESKPISLTAEKKAKKAAEQAVMVGLLAEVLGTPTLEEMKAAMPRPTVTLATNLPSTKMPKRFGGRAAS